MVTNMAAIQEGLANAKRKKKEAKTAEIDLAAAAATEALVKAAEAENTSPGIGHNSGETVEPRLYHRPVELSTMNQVMVRLSTLAASIKRQARDIEGMTFGSIVEAVAAYVDLRATAKSKALTAYKPAAMVDGIGYKAIRAELLKAMAYDRDTKSGKDGKVAEGSSIVLDQLLPLASKAGWLVQGGWKSHLSPAPSDALMHGDDDGRIRMAWVSNYSLCEVNPADLEEAKAKKQCHLAVTGIACNLVPTVPPPSGKGARDRNNSTTRIKLSPYMIHAQFSAYTGNIKDDQAIDDQGRLKSISEKEKPVQADPSAEVLDKAKRGVKSMSIDERLFIVGSATACLEDRETILAFQASAKAREILAALMQRVVGIAHPDRPGELKAVAEMSFEYADNPDAAALPTE